MKLELGKRYVRRDGVITGRLRNSGCVTFPFDDPFAENAYREDGSYDRDENEEDLISEYIEPEVVKDEVKTLRDEVVMAVLPSIIDFYRHALSLDLADGKIDKAEFNTDHLADLIAKDSLEIADAYLAARKERA